MICECYQLNYHLRDKNDREVEPENDAELLREADRRKVSQESLALALNALEEKGPLRRSHTPKGGSGSSTPKGGSVSSSSSKSHSKEEKSNKDKSPVKELEKLSRKSVDEDPEESSDNDNDNDSVHSTNSQEKSVKSSTSTASSSSQRPSKKHKKSVDKSSAKSPVPRSGPASLATTGVDTPASPVPGVRRCGRSPWSCANIYPPLPCFNVYPLTTMSILSAPRY